jgi:hypothetical protein
MNRAYFNNEVDLSVDPKSMNYLEIVTKIAEHKHITLTDAVKKYYDLTGVPSNYDLIMNEDDLLPFGCYVKLTTDVDILAKWGIPLELSNHTLTIGAINICTNEYDNPIICYRIFERPYLEFARDTLVRLKE